MPLELIWTNPAFADLGAYLKHIAQDDPEAAVRVSDRVREAADKLRSFPGLGRPGRLPGARELVIPKTQAILVYHVREEVVYIARVLHAKQQWPWFI